MNGLRKPKGSKILADSLSNARLLIGNDLAQVIKSSKSKNTSSEWVFQFDPNTFTDFSLLELLGPIVDFVYDSSSIVTFFSDWVGES